MRSIYRKIKSWVIPKLSGLWRRVVPVLVPLGVAVLVVGLILFIYLFPEWQVEKLGTIRDPKDFGELVNQYRTTWAQIIGGFFVLVGLYLGWQRVEVAREGQITERFTRAVDQLGSQSLEIRLGGIYALERIARDSEKDHWTVMEVLTAYVREKALWNEENAEAELGPPPTDFQAVLTVIGRRKWIEKETHTLNLNGTNLRGAILGHAHLERAYFREVHLEGATLWDAHLEGADLHAAHLEGALLIKAHLKRATLVDAHLEEAILYLTHLEGTPLEHTYMDRANLYKTHLEGADLRFAQGLTREQIESAFTDQNTKLPDYLKKPPEKEQEET